MSTATELQPGCMAEALQGALETVFDSGQIFPHVYTGPLLKYVVWNYNMLPALWADSRPDAARYLVQVHFYLPHKENPRAAILALQQALAEAGFTWPSITDAADEEGQHWVLECEYADGGPRHGFV